MRELWFAEPTKNPENLSPAGADCIEASSRSRLISRSCAIAPETMKHIESKNGHARVRMVPPGQAGSRRATTPRSIGQLHRAQERASGGGVGTSKSRSDGGGESCRSMAGRAATACGAGAAAGIAGWRGMESTIQVLEEVPQVFSTGFPDSSSLWCVQNRHWHFASAPRWAQQQEVAAGAVSSGSCTASIATTQTPAMAKARHQGIANVRWSQPRLRMSRL